VLRDSVCTAVGIVCAIHRLACQAPSEASLREVARPWHAALQGALEAARAIWDDTPVARYLDRADGPVHLDHSPTPPITRVIGSCYHDLALKVAGGLDAAIEEGTLVEPWLSQMRFFTAAGDDVGQHIEGLTAFVRSECVKGIREWRAEG